MEPPGRKCVSARGRFGLAEEVACVAIAQLAFGLPEVTEGFYKDVAEHIRAGELYMVYENGEAVAFRIIQEKEPGVVYLAGAAKKPGSRKHLVREMTDEIVKEKGAHTIITRTGSDLVLEEMLYLCGRVTPYNSEAGRETIELLAKCGLANPRMREKTLVVPEHYGGSPMVNPSLGRPRSKRSEIAEFMREVMPDEDYFSGAAILLVGQKGDL